MELEFLFKVKSDEQFNRTIKMLNRLGYVWATDFPKEPTFKECKSFYHSNSKLLIHTFYNNITNKKEMCATTMTTLKSYPQYKRKEFCILEIR